MKFLRLPPTAKIKIAKYLRNTLNCKTCENFQLQKFPVLGYAHIYFLECLCLCAVDYCVGAEAVQNTPKVVNCSKQFGN